MVEFHFDVYLRCRAVGDNLKYQWTHNNIVLVPNSHYSIVNESDIVINNVQSSDAGQYQCIVSNNGGRVTSKYATILVVDKGEIWCTYCILKLIVQIVPAPHIITHPTDTSAAAPFSAVFTCSVSAFGYLNIIWYRNNEVYKTVINKSKITMTSSHNVTTSNLIIVNVTMKDSGVYYCEAWANRKASQSRSANLFYAGM